MRLVKRYQEQLPVTSSSSGEKWDLDSILDYSLRVDASLRRKPQKNLMDACEQAVATLRRMEDQNGENDSESSLEYEQDCPLVNFQDTNRMNQSVIGLYQNQKHIAKPLSTPKSDDNIGADESLPLLSSTIESVDLPVNALEPKALQKKDDLRDARSLKRKQKTINNVDTKKSKVADAKWSTPTNRLSDLGGIEQIAKELNHLVCLPLGHPEIYRHLGVDLPRGILLHGPPGCGKTMLAKAIAGEAGVPFICIAAPVVVSGMSGESEKKIREVFDEAKAMAPCILFIDEIDAITPKRETAQREMERRIVAQLLTCMDDLSPQNRSSSLDDTSPSKDDYRHVMIIGATNRPDSIDPALRRAGRFDREICMGVPDENARMHIIQKLSKKMRLEGGFDFRELARRTPGYVGADLNSLTAEAGMVAVNRIFESNTFDYGPEFDPMEITASDGDIAIVEVTKGVEKLASSDLKMSRFLMSHPEPLKQEELDHLSITFLDFLEALKKVQPSSKREGFATVPDVSWDDIGSLKSVRDELRMAVVEPILHPEYFEGVGITSSMGVLLYGPPGCGKTLLAKAVANESRCNFISVKGPELLNKYVGESERAVRTVFSRAQASSPCVIFFDELDALCPSRSNEAESQSASRLVNTLLTEMDGMQGRKQVFVIAATNRPDMIDPAMMRPGRLDKTLYVDLPNKSERFEILKTLTRKTPLSSSLDLHMISEDPRCEGLSGADLASLVREAAVSALRSRFYTNGVFLTPAARSSVDAKVIVDLEHFSIAFSKVPPSVHKKDLKRYELLKVKFSTAELASHQSR
ncbi:hypothetical protein BASA50_010885 [Batrachochytrium salamandrivorans]|uniref:AAA+ ATPase domain-containing protein n=1 Tax=Batrachochytrium salamandrivorans TaxID=1357716 RepID=A0ABQ8EX05_9FUNG|nr:hypothetical protein BASA50_010885 [Batrachochytrium salamandrivorans]